MQPDPARNISTEENNKYVLKNKVDKAEISSSYSGTFEDKRIAVAKSAILSSFGQHQRRTRERNWNAIEDGGYDVPANILAEEILK